MTYRFAANHHNTLEPSATTAVWDGDRLTLYDSTMGVRASQLTVAQLLGMPLSNVRVMAPLRRRRLRRQGDGLAARDARRDGRPARRPAGEARADPAADVHRRTATARSRSSGSTLGADTRRPAHRDPPREAVGHLAVRRLGRAGHRRLARSSTRVAQLPRRAPADPRQHDDADVHPRPRRDARRVHARDRDGRARLPARHRSGRAAAAQPRRRPTRTATRGRATAWPECLRRGAELFGWADRDPTPALTPRRRLADRHRAWPRPATRWRSSCPTQHARARMYADGSAVVETSAPGVRHRRRRPR